MTSQPPRPATAAWLILCAALAAGLAWWSLYLLGLIFLLLTAFGLPRMTPSPRGRLATAIAILAGFDGGMAVLVLLYWFAWCQRDGGFYLYLLAITAAGTFVSGWASVVYLVQARKDPVSDHQPVES